MLCIGTALVASVYRASPSGVTGMVWMMCAIFFFNALRNVRVMVGVALTGGKKKKKREKDDEPPKEP
jgi:hypothetical protein